MAINKFDDYDRLAKLLFPSIEASGNVYYGQTKKLITDAAFGKNEINFNSHIETINGESYFMWKLGQFTGSIHIESTSSFNTNTFPDVTEFYIVDKDKSVSKLDISDDDYYFELLGDVFAKYELSVNNEFTDEIIDSGTFKSYHIEPECEFKGIYVTKDINPVDYDDHHSISNRNFFVSDDLHSLYVRIGTNQPQYKFDADTLRKTPLTILNEDTNTLFVELDLGEDTPTDAYPRSYEYSINNGIWLPCTKVKYPLSTNKFISFRRITPKSESDPTLTILAGYTVKPDLGAKVFGNAYSVLDSSFENITSLLPYGNKCLMYLFSHASLDGLESAIVDARHLLLEAMDLTSYCYDGMFYYCPSLKYAPRLPAKYLPSYCYDSMFSNCSSLIKTPVIIAKFADQYSLRTMFLNCSKLQFAYIFVDSLSSELATESMFMDCSSLWQLYSNLYNTNMGIIDNSRAQLRQPFTIYRSGNNNVTVTLQKHGTIDNVYEVVPENGTPITWDFKNSNSYSITLSGSNRYIEIYLKSAWSQQSEENYVQFSTTGTAGKISLDGNIQSMLVTNWTPGTSAQTFKQYCCYSMFSGCNSLQTDAFLYGTLSPHCFESMYEYCNLDSAHPLVNETSEYCYCLMYYDNTNLRFTPDIYTNYAASKCCSAMFSNQGTSTAGVDSGVNIYALQASKDAFFELLAEDHIKVALNMPNLAAVGLLNSDTATQMSLARVTEYNVNLSQPSHNYKHDYLVTSGMDSNTNGRGLLDDYTKFKMLDYNPFKKEDIELDHYNIQDGSINQEIWGYKQFNSPVSFRNGIYGECTLLTTDPNSDQSDKYSTYLGSYDKKYSLTFNEKSDSHTSAEIKADEISVTGNLLVKGALTEGVLPHITSDSSDIPEIPIGSIIMLSIFPGPLDGAFSNIDNFQFYRLEKYKKVPLTIKNNMGTAKVTFDTNGASYLYALNKTTEFTDYNSGTEIILNPGDFVSFKTKNNITISQSPSAGLRRFNIESCLYSEPKIEVFGNINSLINKKFDDMGSTNANNQYTFYQLFKDCKYITDASNLYLKTTNSDTGDHRFYAMFSGCTNLKYAPELPDNTISDYYYANMFHNCENLITPPTILPAKSVEQSAYDSMFENCSRLQTSPVIIGQTFKRSACFDMFYGCKNLKTGPILSVSSYTSTDNFSFALMFDGCESLTFAGLLGVRKSSPTDEFDSWLPDDIEGTDTRFVLADDDFVVDNTKFTFLSKAEVSVSAGHTFICKYYGGTTSVCAGIKAGQIIKYGRYINVQKFSYTTSEISGFVPSTDTTQTIIANNAPIPFQCGTLGISTFVPGEGISSPLSVIPYLDYEFVALSGGMSSSNATYGDTISLLAMRVK